MCELGVFSTFAQFKNIQTAYEILSDSQKREMYDRFGMDGVKEDGAGPGPSQFPLLSLSLSSTVFTFCLCVFTFCSICVYAVGGGLLAVCRQAVRPVHCLTSCSQTARLDHVTVT